MLVALSAVVQEVVVLPVMLGFEPTVQTQPLAAEVFLELQPMEQQLVTVFHHLALVLLALAFCATWLVRRWHDNVGAN